MFPESVLTWARRFPEREAYRCAEGTLSYGCLLFLAQNLAIYLSQTLSEGCPVGIFGHKERLMPVCMLACALSGHPYVPVDAFTPHTRIRSMLLQSRCALVLGASKDFVSQGVPFLSLHAVYSISSICREGILPPIDPDRPLYILFTSGSTGSPKGVTVPLGHIDAFLVWMRRLFSTDGSLLGLSAFSFDLSVVDLWMPLVTGRCACAIERGLIGDFSALFSRLDHWQNSAMVLTPSFAELLLAEKSFNAARFPALQELFFCGETLRPVTARRLFERFPGLHILNSYGPTECTVAITSCEITPEMACEERLPLGVPRPEATVSIISAHGAPLPEGEIGEILIEGNRVVASYLDAMAGGFCTVQGHRAYRTGDFGFLRDGLLYFCGRRDGQFKLRGVRVEAGDIEQNLLSLPGVTQAVVLPQHRPDGAVRRLVAFVTVQGKALTAIDVRAALSEKLPAAMLPVVRVLDVFPLTQNGKCDRTRLTCMLSEQENCL
ncbi:MAG: AMP-binding protein [Oscillospiraceae bacterium]